MTKKFNPRKLVLNKEVEVSNGIHGHQHRPRNKPKKLYFKIHDLEDFE